MMRLRLITWVAVAGFILPAGEAVAGGQKQPSNLPNWWRDKWEETSQAVRNFWARIERYGIRAVVHTRSVAPYTSFYGPRWGRFHYGVDVGVPLGTPVRTPITGTIHTFHGKDGCGNGLEVRNGDFVVRYCHVSPYNIADGTRVNVGDFVGVVDLSGWTTGPHLHAEFYDCRGGKGCQDVDPKDFFENRDNLVAIAQSNQRLGTNMASQEITETELARNGKYGIGGETYKTPRTLWQELLAVEKKYGKEYQWQTLNENQKEMEEILVSIQEQRQAILSQGSGLDTVVAGWDAVAEGSEQLDQFNRPRDQQHSQTTIRLLSGGIL